MKQIVNKQNKALLTELVRTDFKLRYQGSVLGYAWSLLRPLFMFLILFVVFTKFIRLGGSIPNYPVYLLFGIVLWQFFADMTNQSLTSVVGRGDLIRKIKIPRWMIVLTSSFSALINLGLNLIVVLVFLFFNHVNITSYVLLLPFIILEVYILGLGLSFYLSAAYVKYRDLSFVWEVIMQAGFYLTPIIYPLTVVNNVLFQKILLLNPLAQAIQDARYLTITTDTVTVSSVYGDGFMRAIPIMICVLVFILGIIYFRKESRFFAENL